MSYPIILRNGNYSAKFFRLFTRENLIFVFHLFMNLLTYYVSLTFGNCHERNDFCEGNTFQLPNARLTCCGRLDKKH